MDKVKREKPYIFKATSKEKKATNLRFFSIIYLLIVFITIGFVSGKNMDDRKRIEDIVENNEIKNLEYNHSNINPAFISNVSKSLEEWKKNPGEFEKFYDEEFSVSDSAIRQVKKDDTSLMLYELNQQANIIKVLDVVEKEGIYVKMLREKHKTQLKDMERYCNNVNTNGIRRRIMFRDLVGILLFALVSVVAMFVALPFLATA